MKILISPGFGAGWSTWMHDGPESTEFALRYQPLIDAIEAGEDTTEVVAQFERDYKERFGYEPYIGSNTKTLMVRVIDEPFKIIEYDGHEYLVVASELRSVED